MFKHCSFPSTPGEDEDKSVHEQKVGGKKEGKKEKHYACNKQPPEEYDYKYNNATLMIYTLG